MFGFDVSVSKTCYSPNGAASETYGENRREWDNIQTFNSQMRRHSQPNLLERRYSSAGFVNVFLDYWRPDSQRLS